MASFNYDGKKTRDLGVSCRCHLSNNMPDSVFYGSMVWGMTPFFVFLLCLLSCGNCFHPQNRSDGYSVVLL